MKPIDALTDDEFAQRLREGIGLPEAPPALVRRAVSLWHASSFAPGRTAAGELLRRVVAVLSFDSWASAPAALGVRSGAGDTRHLLYSAMGRDIDLRLAPHADRFAIVGQVLGPDDAGAVELVAEVAGTGAPEPARVATLDDLGGFRIEDVDAGRYVLTLRMSGEDIVLPAFDVGQRTG